MTITTLPFRPLPIVRMAIDPSGDGADVGQAYTTRDAYRGVWYRNGWRSPDDDWEPSEEDAPPAGAPYLLDLRDEVPGATMGWNTDEVPADLSSLPSSVEEVAIYLPDGYGDVTAVLQLPNALRRPICVSATTPGQTQQLAIKIDMYSVFGTSIAVAGGVGSEGVTARVYQADMSLSTYRPYLPSDYMWTGNQLYTLGQGTEYGILHSTLAGGSIDDIADYAESQFGVPVDPALVASVQATVEHYLTSDGNEPIGASFAAYKAGLLSQALILEIFRVATTMQVPAERILYDNVSRSYPGLDVDYPSVQDVLDSLA